MLFVAAVAASQVECGNVMMKVSSRITGTTRRSRPHELLGRSIVVSSSTIRITMFRFNFFEDASSIDSPDAVAAAPASTLECGDVTMEIGSRVLLKNDIYDSHTLPTGQTIRTVNGGKLSQAHSVAKDTDVLPKVYEGGLKIWECSFDAIRACDALMTHVLPTTVLDLGCGAGLVGVFALVKWPLCRVAFQDLNKDVLIQSTAPNVLLNVGDLTRTSFHCGPWDAGLHALGLYPGSFDLIVTADTLYSVESHTQLHDLISNTLRPTTGRALVAAKRFYFGVGGGVTTFLHICETKNLLSFRVLASYEDGASNIRDVIELRTKR